MTMFRRVVGGIRALIRNEHVERELDVELREYLDTAVERKMSAGTSRTDAERAARAEMGPRRDQGPRPRRRMGVARRDPAAGPALRGTHAAPRARPCRGRRRHDRHRCRRRDEHVQHHAGPFARPAARRRTWPTPIVSTGCTRCSPVEPDDEPPLAREHAYQPLAPGWQVHRRWRRSAWKLGQYAHEADDVRAGRVAGEEVARHQADDLAPAADDDLGGERQPSRELSPHVGAAHGSPDDEGPGAPTLTASRWLSSLASTDGRNIR